MKNELSFNHIHPFMAVRREQFADLQKKAEQSPWKEMKQDARKRFYGLYFNSDRISSLNMELQQRHIGCQIKGLLVQLISNCKILKN